MSVRTLIVDDEAPARRRIRRLLAAEPGIAVAGECGDGESALALIGRERPDLVFLDIVMPGTTGLQVLERLDYEPKVIFTTAHDQYAVRAFDIHAFDYLLKPVDQERLRDALGRAMSSEGRPSQVNTTRRILMLLEELSARERGRGRDRLVVRTPERAFFLRTDTVDWVEAAGKFVHLHVGRTVHALRESMAELEQELDAVRFLRISRSAIVNVDRIQEIQPWFQGDYVLILTDGTRLTSTRGYRDNMRKLLGRSA